MNALKRWWPVLFLALVPLLPLWRAVFGGEAIGPWGQIASMAPWNQPAPNQPWDVLQADGVLQFAVWRDLVFEAWGNGELPLWNNYQLMGTPLLANSQSAGFYPPHILLGVLQVPTLPGITFLAWFHLFWAGLGVFYLVRRMGGNRLGGTVAGASFSLSSFMVAWTPLASVITTVSWIPWVLGLIVATFVDHPLRMIPEQRSNDLVQEGMRFMNEKLSAQSRLWRRLVYLALSTGMLVLAGHLQFVAYGLLAAGLLVLVLTIAFLRPPFKLADLTVIAMRSTRTGHEAMGEERRGSDIPGYSLLLSPGLRSVLACAIALGLGAMLAAPQLLPVLEYSKFSHRQNVASEEGYQAYLGGAVSWFQLPGVVFPSALGNPTQLSENEQLQRLGASSYWPALSKVGANFAESALSIGPVVLVLLAFLGRRWKDPAVIGVAFVAALGLLIALGTGFNRLLYFGVPGWSATGSPGRAGVLFVLGLCTLAGIGASQAVTEWSEKKARIAGAALLVFGLLLLSLPLNFSTPDPYQIGEQVLSSLRTLPILGGIVPALVASALAAAWMLIPNGRDLAKRAALLAAAVLVWPLAYNLAFPVHTGEPFARLQESPRGRIAVINVGWDLLGRPRALMPPNTPAWSRLHAVAGYDSLLHRDTKTFLDSINQQDSAPPANGNMLLIKPSFEPERLADAGVTEIWTKGELEGLGQPRESRGNYGIYDLPGPGRVSSTGGLAEIVDEGFQSITVRAQGPGKLILRDRLMPGWAATLNGEPISLPNALFREVDLPAGESTVVFRYDPPGLSRGLQLSALAGLVLLAILGFATVWRRREP